MHFDDKKRLFLKMQEHPEDYSDEQLEAMMEDIDRLPDTAAAGRRFAQRNRPVRRALPQWARVAAAFFGTAFLAGMVYAAVYVVRKHSGKTVENTEVAVRELPTSDNKEAVRFDNAPLDSVLTVVAAHYGKEVKFGNEKLRRKKLIMTWRPGTPLPHLIERLNAFDGIGLELQEDTIVVSIAEEGEEEP